MSALPFDDLVATCAKVRTLPLARRRALLATFALSPEDKVSALIAFAMRRFFQEKRGEPDDRLTWVFATAAVGPRETLPWTRGAVAHMVRATKPRPETFPPALIVRAVEQFAASFGKPLPRELCGWIAQAADALARHASDAAARRATARLRILAAARGSAPVTPRPRAAARPQSSSSKTK